MALVDIGSRSGSHFEMHACAHTHSESEAQQISLCRTVNQNNERLYEDEASTWLDPECESWERHYSRLQTP